MDNSARQGIKPPNTFRAIFIKITLLICSGFGIAVAGYLLHAHVAQISPVCLAQMKCDVVLNSRFTEIWGVPLSLFGLLLYSLLFLLSIFNLIRNRYTQISAVLIYILTLSGLIFSLYLLYLEAFVIHDYCTWCVASGIIMLGLFVLSVFNLTSLSRRLGASP